MSKPQDPSKDASEPTASDEQALDETKEAMRRALEAKKAAQRHSADGTSRQKSMGGPHGKEGGARQFRRKSG